MSDEPEDAPADADVEDEVEESSESDDPDPDEITDDDVIRLAYTARSVESEQLVDTTDPAVAEEEGVDTEEQTFEPRVVALGAGHVFPAVETAIIGSAIGDTGTVEVPPGEAFGEFDPDNVRTVSADSIPEDDRYPGAQVEMDGEHGFVETIIGGRARVDFNHPLAGEAIEYEFEILDRIDDRLEIAQGLLGAVVDADLEMWIETEETEQVIESDTDDDDESSEDEEPETELVDVETLYVESVPQLALNQQWMFRKQQIAQDVIDRLDIDRVIVQETIEGMGGGLGGLGGLGDLEAAIDDVDVDADEIAEDLDADLEDEIDFEE